MDDQAFLSQIEENIRSKADIEATAQAENQQRADEMKRLREMSGNLTLPGKKSAGSPSVPAPSPARPSNPLENDPRYKEYFERLRRQRGDSPTPATGNNLTATPPAGSAAMAGKETAPKAASVGPGSIVRFDDGSIGVYKDAVSGRDYALFYFLQPDGGFTPQGVFLQCYQAVALGTLPEQYFERARDEGKWSRDLIVFHMNDYGSVKFLDDLKDHVERKPTSNTPARNASLPAAQPSAAPSQTVAATTPPAPTASGQVEPVQPEPVQPASAPTPPAGEATLVKGRRFQIKFSGKQWEAVYWMDEGKDAIVAHDTHGKWSLMRLDLTRFKDSLELLDIVDGPTMQAIAEGAAAGA